MFNVRLAGDHLYGKRLFFKLIQAKIIACP